MISDQELSIWFTAPGLHRPKVVRLIDEIRQLRSSLAKVRQLHQKHGLVDREGTWYVCYYDEDHWPCRTIAAIGEDDD